MKRSSSGGQSILEFAIVLPIFLAAILGTVDISNVLRAKSAVRKGVEEALRCSYTIDGQCVDASSLESTTYYNVYQRNVDTTYVVDTINYSAEASWIVQPAYQSVIEADVVGSVNYDLQQYEYLARPQYFPAAATFQAPMRIASLPYITGTTASSPQFVFRNAPSIRYPAAVNRTLSSNAQVTSGVAPILTTSFTIPRPTLNSNGRCRVSSSLDSGLDSHAPALSRLCDESPPVGATTSNPNSEISDHTFIVFHIAGNGAGTALGAEGVVNLEICTPNCRSLGGRMFSGPVPTTHGSFFPRGLRNEAGEGRRYLDQSTIQNPNGDTYTEFTTHGTIRVPYDTPVRIRLELEHRSGGAVQWNAERLRVYTPLYRDSEEIEVDCNKASPCGASGVLMSDIQSGDIATCEFPAGVEASEVEGSLVATSDVAVCLGSPIGLGCSSSNLSAEILLASSGVAFPQDYLLEQGASGSCSPQRNFSEACGPFDYTLHQGSFNEVCPPSGPEIQAGAIPLNVSWGREVYQEVSSTPWVKSSCSDVDPYLSTRLEEFPSARLIEGRRIEAKDRNLYQANLDPSELLQTENYNCAGFALGSTRYDSNYPGSESTVFAGSQLSLGCSSEQALYDAAVSLGMSGEAYFEVLEPVIVGKIETPLEVIDSCVPFQVKKDPSTETFTLLGEFAEGELPSICTTSSVECDYRFAHRDRVDGEGAEIEAELAAHLGFNAVQAMMPTSQFGCSGPNCTNIEIIPEEELIRASAEMQVPLSILFGGTTLVSYQDWETRETSIIKQAG